MAPSIYVGILNWNGSAMALRCVEHILRQTCGGVKVAVIDNGSRSDEVTALRSGLAAACELVALPQNLGFAGGMNVALSRANREGCEFVWLLNNDAFAEPDCLARLTQALAEDPQLAVVTPRLDGTDGLEQHVGASVDWNNGEHHHLFSAEIAETIPPGCWLTGTALLLRTQALQKVGYFDPAFFAYWEDVDLCIRLANQGHRLRAVPEARCLHLGSASTGGARSAFAQYMMTRNAWLFLRKHLRGTQRLRSLFGFASSALTRAAFLVKRGEDQQSSAILAGVLAALRNQTGPAGSLDFPPLLRRFLMWKWYRITALLRRCASLEVG